MAGLRPLYKMIHQKQRKSNAGRESHDMTPIFEMLPPTLHNLFDDRTERRVRDRPSLQRHVVVDASQVVDGRFNKENGDRSIWAGPAHASQVDKR